MKVYLSIILYYARRLHLIIQADSTMQKSSITTNYFTMHTQQAARSISSEPDSNKYPLIIVRKRYIPSEKSYIIH
ncbi:hypothetical protein SAMN05216323_100464 [Williamwhitmania taraxaci]|uniref:Uncharacterized protein n=1 Tax=Williamwhitmania taraxaci TaxID=1640674 RepID=A0A1G6GVD4_9BACT|nr:hypothetical protein SAMN05216323_100464 [Williamwhitmania taraxaci]